MRHMKDIPLKVNQGIVARFLYLSVAASVAHLVVFFLSYFNRVFCLTVCRPIGFCRSLLCTQWHTRMRYESSNLRSLNPLSHLHRGAKMWIVNVQRVGVSTFGVRQFIEPKYGESRGELGSEKIKLELARYDSRKLIKRIENKKCFVISNHYFLK